MGELEWRVGKWIEQMRTEGSIVVHVRDLGVSVEEWRSAMRKAARREGLRIRTALAPEGSVVCAFHVDHVLTEPEYIAGIQAAWARMAGKPGPTYEQRLAEERRKHIRVVPEPESD